MTNARDLSNQLADLLRREHVAMADFLLALADFDRKRLWLDLGYPSLWYFLHRELGLSKGAATFRKSAAELVERYPEVIEPLRDGRLCISSVVELGKVITPENRHEVLPRFFHRSKQEAKVVAREIDPVKAPPQRDVVTSAKSTTSAEAPPRPVPVASAPSRVHPDEPAVHLDEPGPVHPDELEIVRAAAPTPGPREERDRVEPLTAKSSRIHVTVSRGFLEKVEAARSALSHSMPDATLADVLEAGLDLVLAAHAKRKGLVAKPRKTPPPSTSDHIPAHVKRAVWERDGGRCAYPMPGGGVCASTHKLELDHLVARALGGKPTVENIGLRCRAHNLANARETFGDALMDVYTRNPRKPDLVREPVAACGGRLGLSIISVSG
jgi:hypothetical protein